MIEAASIGDIAALRKFVGIGGLDALNAGDYDGRTVLHLACAEGHTEMVEFLLSVKGLNLSPKDRWGMDPMKEAKANNKDGIVSLLRQVRRRLSFLLARVPLSLSLSLSLHPIYSLASHQRGRATAAHFLQRNPCRQALRFAEGGISHARTPTGTKGARERMGSSGRRTSISLIKTRSSSEVGAAAF